MMAERIWVSWNEQRRNIGLAEAVHARLYMSDMESLGVFRLPFEMLKSWIILNREKPQICFTMNPSIFSSWWLSVLSELYGFRLVTDLHTPNLMLSGIKKKIFEFFLKSGIRRSDIVIVTNEIYLREIKSLNRNTVIVPDPLPELKSKRNSSEISDDAPDNKKIFRILFICSFDPDEPVREVLSLDPELEGFEVIVSGNWGKMYGSVPNLHHIRFTGFLSRSDYDSLLQSVDGIITLTNEEGCLCCGAYEAFAAGKPVILSKTKALQQHFGSAPVYTDNSAESILRALKQLDLESTERKSLVNIDKLRLERSFLSSINELESELSKL